MMRDTLRAIGALALIFAGLLALRAVEPPLPPDQMIVIDEPEASR